MAKPFWGLYDGLDTGSGSTDSTTSLGSTTQTPNTDKPNHNENTATESNNNGHSNNKRKIDSVELGLPIHLVPRSKRVAVGPAPRALQQKKLNITTTPTSTAPATTAAKPTVVVKQDDMVGEDIRSSNITLALNEIKDPYDPAHPNDYEQYLQEKKKREEERMFEAMLPAPKTTAKKNVGEDILKKMGWKGKGHGLGRNDQGMALPLLAQKSGSGAQGIIVNQSHLELQKKSSNPTGSQSSRVIVLTNMVGPGQIDDMLEKETTQECSKYGTVLSCVAIEDTRPGTRAEEAVKIFVKFKYEDQSLKALMDLDGRYFGGRNVRADYFNEECFNNREF